MKNYAIKTIGLTHDFGQLRAVDNLSLEVPAGSIFGFLGPNGSGKTTTIHLLLGLLNPTDGCATVLGHDIHTASNQIREKSGALLEHHGLYEKLNAEDNLDFYGRIYHLPKSERKARIKDMMQHLNLWDRRHEPIDTWSRGMKQKLAVARTMLHHPQLIFLDEPTAGLDPVAAAALRNDLEKLAQREGVTIFLTTHNLDEAQRLCDHVAIIRQGKLLLVDTPDSIRSQSENPRYEIHTSDNTNLVADLLQTHTAVNSVAIKNSHINVLLNKGADIAPLVSLIVSQGYNLEEVKKINSSLESVFLKLMEENNVD